MDSVMQALKAQRGEDQQAALCTVCNSPLAVDDVQAAIYVSCEKGCTQVRIRTSFRP